MTWTHFWLIVLGVSVSGIALTLLAMAGRWIWDRADRDADVTRFANAITAENADVVAQEAAAYSDSREALVDEMVGLLDGAIDDIEALSDAADLVDELEGLEALLDDMGTHTNRLDRAAAA